MQRRIFLLTALILALFAAACGKEPTTTAIAPGQIVLAFGDSVTYGTGAGPDEDWPSVLASSTGWRIENAGIPGDTAEKARERLPALLETHRPALVIVELGGNDFLRRRPQSAVKEDLRAIIRQIRAQNAQVVLIAVPELSLLSVVARNPSDAPLYAELAKEEQVSLIPDVFSEILGRPELCADQIHPNAAGYARMAAGFLAHLQKIGLTTKP